MISEKNYLVSKENEEKIESSPNVLVCKTLKFFCLFNPAPVKYYQIKIQLWGKDKIKGL